MSMDKKDREASAHLSNLFRDVGVHKSPESEAIGLDVEKYRHFLEECELSEAQKEQFLETLWLIIVSFVDLGFGVHPLQQVLDDAEPNFIDPESSMTHNKPISKQSISKTITW